MIIKDIIEYLEELAPIQYSLNWDNCGIQIGNKNIKVKNIGIALTPTTEIIEKAIENDCNFLITHHPLIFQPLKNIDTSNFIGKIIELSIKNDITIYTMHTNFDSCENGLNYEIAKKIGLDNISVLSVNKEIEMVKLVTFVPEDYTINVINAISDEGAGRIGKLSHCSYITAGIATFIDEKEQRNNLEIPNKETEDKLEIIVPSDKLDKVLKKLKSVHPYNDHEIVYDIYKLENHKKKVGIGVVGEFYTPFKLEEIFSIIKDFLNLKKFTYIGNKDKMIKKVAICTGSGGSLLNQVKKNNADLYITGDIKYHTAIDAKEMGISIIDAGHYYTEILFLPFISKYLSNFVKEHQIIELKENDPFNYYY